VPAFRAIRATFPDAETCIVTSPLNDGVVRGNPYLDHVLLFDKVKVRSSPAAAWQFLRALRGFSADLAIVLNSVSYSGTSTWIAVLSGANRIIGGDSRPFGWSFSDWLYNLVLRSSRTIEGHAIDYSLAPLLEAGFKPVDRNTTIGLVEKDHQHASRFLDTVGPSPRAALHPGAGKRENCWPPERFAEVARRLRSDGYAVYLIEGPADGEAVEATQRAFGGGLPVLKDVSIRTVAAALAATQLALVNDTGVMHVAGAVGVPTVAMFGPTPAATWKPPSSQLCALQSPDGHMESLAVEEVWGALQSASEGSGPLDATGRD